MKEYIKDCPDAVPSLCGFALDNEIGESTLSAWGAKDLQEDEKAKYPMFTEFQGMLRALQSHQARTMLNGGADNSLNSTICKLVLAKHGYHDKVDKHLSGNVALVPSVEINLPDDKPIAGKGLDDE